MPVKYVYVDGVPVFVHHAGPTTLPAEPPDLSRGETIICLHGAGGNGGYLSDLLRELAERTSPLAFDQPGHGRSGGLDSLGSIDRMAAFTRALVQKLGIERPVLFGHSMGGAVALSYALEHPGDVRALVLCSSSACFTVPEPLVSHMRRVTEGKERRAFRRDAYSPKTSDEIVQRGWMEDGKTDPRAGYGDLLACQRFDVSARLAEIDLPTLTVVGEEEHPPLRKEAESLAATISGARKVVVPDAGHALPLEQPKRLAEAILAFLDEECR
jgi:pimeloyl-ACP methyl ester carboxylesterase